MKRARQRTRRRDRQQQVIRQVSTAALQQQPQQQPDQAPPIHPILHMQRTVGNRRTQAHIQRITDEEKADLQHAFHGLETMLYYGSTKASVLKTVPDEYREAIQAVNVANINHQGYPLTDVPEARAAVEERFSQMGIAGMFMVAAHGDELTLREQVKRQQKAVSAWRVAYPAIQNLLQACQGAGISTQNARLKVDDLHQRVIDKLPELVSQQGTLPENVELAETYFEAKSVVTELDGWMKRTNKALKALDAYKARAAGFELAKASDGVQLPQRKQSLGEQTSEAFNKPRPTPSGGTTPDAGDADIGDRAKLQGFDMGDEPLAWEGPALDALKALKTITGTPEAWASAVKDYQEGKKAKGVVGMASLGRDIVGDVALPIVKYGVSTTEALVKARSMQAFLAETGSFAEVLEPAALARVGKLKAGLEAFEKGFGVASVGLDLIGGMIELSDGLNTNSYDSIVGGSLSIAEGLVTVGFGASVGTIAAPFFAYAKVMTHIIGETVKMYGAMHLADMKDALQDIVLRAQYAGEATNAFMIAAGQADGLASGDLSNPVDADLHDSYQRLAVSKAHAMVSASEHFVNALYESDLGDHEVMIQSFDQGAGGVGAGQAARSRLQALAEQAAELDKTDDPTASLISLGHELSDIMPKILTGIQYVAQSVRGIESDIQTVDFFSPDQQHDSIELKAYWTQAEDTLYWYYGYFGVKSPINDLTYQQRVYDRHKGKAIGDIRGIPVHINVTVELEKPRGTRVRVMTLQFVDGQFKDVGGASVESGFSDLVQATGNRLKQSTLPSDATLAKN